jgi:hypothetical protein
MAKKDINQLAKFITSVATGESEDINKAKKPSITFKGRVGGLKGGDARAKALTTEQRSAIAKKAAEKRWGAVK